MGHNGTLVRPWNFIINVPEEVLAPSMRPHQRCLGLAPTMALYRNAGPGRFAGVSRAAGGALADYDADLFLTAVGPNRLYRNDGRRRLDVGP